MSSALPIRIRAGAPGWILIELPYTPERVEKIKTLAGRIWLDDHHCWAVPKTARLIDRLNALFSGDQIAVAPELRTSKPAHPGQRPLIPVAPGSARESLRAFIQAMNSRAYRPHTIDIYALHVRRFLQTVRKSPLDLKPDDVRHYLDEMAFQVAETYRNQAIRAIQAFLSLSLNKDADFIHSALPPRKTVSRNQKEV